jgi:carbamoyltransferase
VIILGFIGGSKRAEDDDIAAGFRHDSAAAIFKDGELVAAIEEERLNRIKHTNCFPSGAIEFCRSQLQARWDDIDLIVTAADPASITGISQSEALLDMTSAVPHDAGEYIASLFRRDLGIDPRPKLRFLKHHEGHVWSAYSFSGFSEALILSIDGAGDGLSGSVYIGNGNRLTRLRDYSVGQSLGHFYLNVIRLIGFSYFDEYKAMGLAPYGDPATFKGLFDAGYELLADGNYRLDHAAAWAARFEAAGLLTSARRKSEPFQQVHMDLAAALQAALENIVFHVLKHYHWVTGIKSLCLAGGVAHNCTLNGKILTSGLFDRMFVQPAAHDAGLALGACCALSAQHEPALDVKPMRHVFFGTDCADIDASAEIRRWDDFLEIVTDNDGYKRAAELLADGAVVGRVDGRAEFGPRALGNRSILADPRRASHKELINSMVKKREQFRPFAPAVTVDRAKEFFDIPACEADLSYMTYTLSVKPEWRPHLGAVVHCDGTARLQTVDRQANPTFWTLLREMEVITGIPILLNTSFNNNAEPIVDTAEDAIACYLTTGLDYLLLGSTLVRKHASSIAFESFMQLVPELPPTARIAFQRTRCGTRYFAESLKANLDRRHRVQISAETYHVLSRDAGSCTVGDLLERDGIRRREDALKITEELNHLWASRLIRLRPRV